MQSMKCRQIEECLPLYVSGEITRRKGRRVGLHLEACPRCRAEFETYLSLRVNLRELGNLPDEASLDGFYEALLPVLDATASPGAMGSRGSRGNPRGRGVPVLTLRRASLAAATLLIAMIAAYAFLDGNDDRSGRPAASEHDAAVGGAALTDPFGSPESASVEPYQPRVTAPVDDRSVRGAPLHRARFESSVTILAGPRISVPLEPPSLPVDIPIPRVQPYAWPVQRPQTTAVQFH